MLIYEENIPGAYRAAFKAKVKQISAQLGVNPNWLMAIMNWESAQTFSPSITNPYTNATGLIQFMPSTAIGLGTTVSALANMTAEEQLDWVYKYYKPYKAKIKGYSDLYLATFYPAAIGKPNSYVLGSNPYRVGLIAQQNPSFDNNDDGRITKGEIVKDMLAKIPDLWKSEFGKKVMSVGLLFLMIAGFTTYKLITHNS